MESRSARAALIESHCPGLPECGVNLAPQARLFREVVLNISKKVVSVKPFSSSEADRGGRRCDVL